jgi:hypothetical protein
MRQVVQSVRSGETSVRELPDPVALRGGVVVANVASVVSDGTECSLVELQAGREVVAASHSWDHRICSILDHHLTNSQAVVKRSRAAQ